jgi:hypothetical protein
MRSSHYVLYRGTPLGHFEWSRDVVMTVVTPGDAISIVAIKLPMGHVTIGILPALPLGTVQSILISAGANFSLVFSVRPVSIWGMLH